MGTVELRNLITKYAMTADEEVLRIVRAVFETYQQDGKDFFDELPLAVKELLVNSKDQVLEGNLTYHKDVISKARARFNVK